MWNGTSARMLRTKTWGGSLDDHAVDGETLTPVGSAAVEMASGRGASVSTRTASPPSVIPSPTLMYAGIDDSTLEARMDVTRKGLDNANWFDAWS